MPTTITNPDNESELIPSKSGFIKIDYLSLVKIEGSDAESFLQGQLTNDLSLLKEHCGQVNAYCTPKGRALAIFQLFRDNGCFWMLIPQDITDSLLKRLRMFVMRSKVAFTIQEKSNHIGAIGRLPESISTHQSVFQLNDHFQRTLVIDEHNNIDISSIANSAMSGDVWKLLDIRSGIAQVYENTTETFIPQNVNLEIIDGVSFSKGCYPGQEIVARLKYLGKSKQRMGRAKIKLQDNVTPGDSIFSEERPNQKSGVIVDAVKVTNDCFEVSVMIPASKLNMEGLHLNSESGPVLEYLELPYSIPVE